MTNLSNKLVTVTEIKKYLRIFIVLLFFTFSLLAQNNDNPPKSSETPIEAEKHRIYFQTGYGYGSLRNANDSITRESIIDYGIVYSALNRGDYIPIQATPDKSTAVHPGRRKMIPSHNSLEYRYTNKIRLYLENRIFSSNSYENNFAYLPSKDVSFGSLYSKTLFFQEERYKIGGAYFFSIFENFSIGLVGNYYAIQQISSRMNVREFLNPYYANTTFSTKNEKFYGFVPGLAIELKLNSRLEIVYSFEKVDLKSEDSGIYTVNNIPSALFFDAIDNKLIGNFNKLVFIYRPFSWFGLHLGFVKEFYRKKYGSDIYVSTSGIAPTAYIADIIISNAILRSNHFNQNLNYAYLQFEFSKGF